MRRVFAVLATLLVLAVVAQFFLAASGAFDTAPKQESFQEHRSLGYGIALIAVLSAIVAAVSRAPGRLIAMTALITVLGLVQGLIRAIATAFDDTGGASTLTGRLVFGLHAVNALIILAVAENVARQARALPNTSANTAAIAQPVGARPVQAPPMGAQPAKARTVDSRPVGAGAPNPEPAAGPTEPAP